MNFSIKLPQFEGPFDLLLFFIRRDELDIHDIPIAEITANFLAYLQQMEELNMDIAGEFILVASTLMRIKSRMLLPRPELDEAGNEIDPREELVRNLLEYKRYKETADLLERLAEDRDAQFSRANLAEEIKELTAVSDTDAEWESLNLYKLMQTYGKVMEQFAYREADPVHRIRPYPYSVDTQKEFLTEMVSSRLSVSFEEIVRAMPSRIGVIFNLLALLELVQIGLFGLEVGETSNHFRLIWRGEPAVNIVQE